MLHVTQQDYAAPLVISSDRKSLDELEQQLATLAAHLNAGDYRFLELLAEFDRQKGYVGYGILSCAHWLSWKCGVSLVAARERVRVAKALRELPKISEAMRRGSVSYCKVRAMTRVANRDNEAYLLTIAEHGTVTHVERTVRLYRRAMRGDELMMANRLHEERLLDCYFDEDGSVVIRGRLPAEQGALVMKALQAAEASLRSDSDASREASRAPDRPAAGAALRADALAAMAEVYLAGDAGPVAAGDRHLVTVHIDERVLRDETQDGRCELAHGPALPPATVRRLCCDASLVAVVENDQGHTADVGRKTRAIPAALRRALDARDRGCRFPDCTNHRFVDGHHIVHWADGGETTLDNLILLCRRHHRFVHECGFRIARDDAGLHFTAPDDRRLEEAPPASCVERGGEQLLERHVQAGLVIDARTQPTWSGERMDYAWVMVGLCNATAPATH